MRRLQNTFLQLATRMIGFGLFIGIVFPFFMLLLGVSRTIAFSSLFLASCVIAGVLVGFFNIVITSVTVKRKLTVLTGKMQEVKGSIITISENGRIGDCNPEHCSIPVETDDEFGQSAQAFNELISSFASSLKMLDDIKTFTAIFSSQLDLHTLSEYALDRVMKGTSSDAGALLLEHEGQVVVLHSFGIREAQGLSADPHILRAFSKGESSSITHPEHLIVESTLTQFHPKAVIIEPVKFKNVPIAMILLAKSESFQAETVRQLSIFSQSLAVALHNALEHEQLQKLAALDPLTGILNRRFGMVRLHEEYSRSVRRGVPLAILMFDIDHFKQVNDTYGHVVGDRVLRNIASQIRQGIREGDVLLRYGGEEFMVILPGASKEDAFAIAERVRHIVRENITTYGENKINVTISVGLDSMPETTISGEMELIANADEALYRSKNAGRDRTTIHC
ncbi:MAG: GGDEF domain-containing protein [Clostridiales bacterium]|nr:GGDEF domain-containing protein [Clostridiales bacterium]